MSDRISIELNSAKLMAALARLKKLPLAKIVHNAAKDFAQGAHRATPIASITKSQYYTFLDKNGVRKYVPASRVLTGVTRTGNATLSNFWKSVKSDKDRNFRKVRLNRGWSKATWIGVFRSLGMESKPRSPKLSPVVERKSDAQETASAQAATVSIKDTLSINNFGKGDSHGALTAIAQSGYALAAKRLASAVNGALRKQWQG